MVTRFNIPAPKPGQWQLPNGYTPNDEQPSEYHVPPCGIETIDKAIFKLFDNEMPFSSLNTAGPQGANAALNIKKPTVIFATGERFAIVKKLRPVRDRNGALMLPAISIRRTSINQTYDDMSSRGMNAGAGTVKIKRKLSSEDRRYQNIINKIGLKNMSSLTETRRQTGQEANDIPTKQGLLLDPKIGDNIYEILTIPQPQYVTLSYEIVFWTGYTEQMNYMIESLLSAQLPTGKNFKLVADTGYWFVASMDDGFQSTGNIEDFTEEERVLRYSFNMTVPAFILIGPAPGLPVPVKSYITATQFSFEMKEDASNIMTERQAASLERDTDDKYVLSDLEAQESSQPKPTQEDAYLYKKIFKDPYTGKERVRFVKIKSRRSKKGETYYAASDPEILEEYFASIRNKR